MTAAWFIWALRMTMTQVPAVTQYTIICQSIKNIPAWTWIINLFMGIFDLLVLCLSLETLCKNIKEGLNPFWKSENQINDVSRKFYFDTVLYFAFSFSVAMMSLGWTYAHPQDQFYSGIISPV